MRRRIKQTESTLPIDNAAAVAALQRLIEARSQAEAPAHARKPHANRWLSPELLQNCGQTRGSSRNAAQTTQPEAVVKRQRKLVAGVGWQALAATLLLLGSGAFSYLAWSRAVEAPAAPTAEVADAPLSTKQSTNAVANPSAEHATLSARVRTLREENLGLRERLAALEKASL